MPGHEKKPEPVDANGPWTQFLPKEASWDAKGRYQSSGEGVGMHFYQTLSDQTAADKRAADEQDRKMAGGIVAMDDWVAPMDGAPAYTESTPESRARYAHVTPSTPLEDFLPLPKIDDPDMF